MCGIAGWIDLKRRADAPDLIRAVEAMCDAIRHRGPDDSGTWVDPELGIALGHRRLSILDLSVEGRQPMVSADGRYVLTFNGEIYNFEALRSDVADYPFRGRSDSEVLLATIQKYGVQEAAERHNGMMAAVVWDRDTETLSLIRDRLGKKPLYYGVVDGCFVFASELRAIEAVPNLSLSIDREALNLFTAYKNVPAPFSIYEDIYKVEPGTIVSMRLDSMRDRRATEYWNRDALPHQPRGGVENPLQELDALLADATSMRLASDVPLGAFLSGGFDSSLIVGLMQSLSERPVSTFSIGFEEATHDESEHAQAVAHFLGTDHHAWKLSAQDGLETIPDLNSVYDEPFADASQIPTMLLCKRAREHVTVALSGDGGDEIFGGYPRYHEAPLDRVSHIGPVRRALHVASTLAKGLPGGSALDKNVTGLNAVTSDDVAKRYLSRMRRWKRGTPIVLGIEDVWQHDRYLELEPPTELFRETGMFMDLCGYLPDDILVKVDRASMAVSLECRAPILDYRVAEFSWRLTDAQRCPNGVDKGLLKQLAYRYVPQKILDRPKQGFGIPVNAWLRGDLKQWAAALLDPTRLRSEGFFDVDQISSCWSEHQKGTHEWGADLWSVLMFQNWLSERPLHNR